MKKYIIITLIALGALGCNLNYINDKVAQDFIDQYYIAKKHGSAMEASVYAGLVCAAFLQAKDEENYKKWKKIHEIEEQRASNEHNLEWNYLNNL